MLVSWRDAAAAAFSSSAAPNSSKHFAVHATGNPPQLQGGRCWARGEGGSSHTSGGTPAAILPTSSSACIIFLMRAAGKRGLSPLGGMVGVLPHAPRQARAAAALSVCSKFGGSDRGVRPYAWVGVNGGARATQKQSRFFYFSPIR